MADSCARIHSAGHALDVAMAALGYTIRPTKGFHFPDGPYVEYEAASAAERLSSEAKDALPAALTAKMAELSAASAADPASVGDTVVAWLGKDAANDLLQRFNGTGVDAAMFPSPDSLVRLTRLAGGWIPCGGTHVASVAAIGPVTVTRAKAKKNTLKVSASSRHGLPPAGYAASAAARCSSRAQRRSAARVEGQQGNPLVEMPNAFDRELVFIARASR